MFNEAQVSMTGYVATQPKIRPTSSGTPLLSMRVAWTPRHMDRMTGEWTDGNTSYITVVCWRKVATNAGTCLKKGDPVIVKGRLSVRPYTDKNGIERNEAEIEALAVGHDLSRGVALSQRVQAASGKTAEQHAAELAALANGGPVRAGAEPSVADRSDNGQAASGGMDDEEAAAMVALDRAGLVNGSADPEDGDMFDDSAIEALAQEADKAAVPF